MHELKPAEEIRVTENMTEEEEGSKSICVTELGQSVLTLAEVLQTFEESSAMFKINLYNSDSCRTVVLKKNYTTIDGETKMIVMIRDVSDKMRLEQEEVKNKKEKERTFLLQRNLDEVFSKHSDEVDEICKHLNKYNDRKLNKLVDGLKKTNFNLFFNYCQFNDLINIKNDTFR